MHQQYDDLGNVEKVINSLSGLKTLIKYDNTIPEVYFHKNSAYMLGDKLNAKIECLERKFESVTKIPMGTDFESSEDCDDFDINIKIGIVNEKCRAYCDTLFYIDKFELLEFMNSKYNSIAKLNKIKLVIELNDGIKFKFTPFKKSTSVFPSEYRIDTTINIFPNFRIESGEIYISALLLHQALNNDLLDRYVKIEINTRKGFLRVSGVKESVVSKFTIGKIEEY